MKKCLIIFEWVSFLFFLFSITACDDIYKRETITLASPSIRIISAESSSFNAVELVVEINKGEGQLIEECALYFEDITVLENPIFKRVIDFNSDSVIHYKYRSEKNYHDYQVQAVLVTDKYTYTTPKQVIRTSKNTFDFSVCNHYFYSEAPQNVADFLVKGGRISLSVKYANKFIPSSVEVKLNGEIDLEHTLDFDHYSYSNAVLETSGSAVLPDSISAGYYDVYVYLDSSEFKCSKGIQVLNGKWSLIDNEYPGANLILYNSFVKDDKLYLIGGRLYATRITHFPVWCFDLKTKIWRRMKNFPDLENVGNSLIYPQSLVINNQAYILLKNDTKFELWKYFDNSDKWQYVATYPGASLYNLTSFAIGEKVYLGGGDNNTDFWVYNTISDTWAECNAFPVQYSRAGGYPTAVGKDGMAYMVAYRNNIWKYNPSLDKWSELTQFHDYYRSIYHLIEKDGKLTFVGGQDNRAYRVNYNDCWSFDLHTKEWELNAFVPEDCTYGILFEYDDAIYTGLNFIYSEDPKKTIYRLDF